MIEIATQHLFDMEIEVPLEEVVDIGSTPHGSRIIVKVVGGSFAGPVLAGSVVGGDDWLLSRPDGVMQLDCRMTLKTDDNQMICMTYRGYRHGPQEVIDRINRGEEVEPSEYYHRVAPFFETASDKYAWLNGVLCIAVGHKRPWGGAYSVHQVI